MQDRSTRDLKQRIYDKGFKLTTMPSVNRPDSIQSQQKPMQAKIFNTHQKLKDRHIVVLQPQSTILHRNNKQQPEEQVEGDFQQIIEKDEIQSNQQHSSRQNSPSNNKVEPTKTANKFGMTMGSGFNSKSNQFMQTNMSQMRGTETALRSTFNKTEMNPLGLKQKHFVLDKISGKFNIDKRWNTQSHPFFQQQANKTQNVNLQDKTVKISKREVTDLDMYIDLIMKNAVNLDDFLYLVRNNEDDPYDLEMADYSDIKKGLDKQNNIKSKNSDKTKDKDVDQQNVIREYYTISKKGLCQFINNKPIEFIPLANFIRERETYDEIKSLTFFTQFRKWKTLKMWKKNILRHQMKNVGQQLEDKLFILHPILSKTLLKHRSWCCDMEKLRFIEIQVQQYGINMDVPTIQLFKQNQERKQRLINESIQEQSNRCRQNVREGFQACLDELRRKQYQKEKDDDMMRPQNDQQQHPRYKETAYENLGFPDNMTYEDRSELRKECSRFLKFSYLVDFIALNSLKNIYSFSVVELIDELKMNVEFTEPKIARDKGSKPFSKPKEPMFLATLKTDVDQEWSESQYEIQKIKEFKTYPLGNDQVQDYNMCVHLRLQEEETQEEKQQEEEEQQEPMFDYKVLPNLTHDCLEVSPSQDSVIGDITNCVIKGLESIQIFERWSRHDEMTAYVNVLEEWDYTVAEDWESPDSNYLQVSEWLDCQPSDFIRPQLEKLISYAYGNIYGYLKTFKAYLDIYYHNSQVDLELFKNDKLINPGESLQNSLALLYWQKEFLEKEIPYIFDLGLLRVDCTQFKLLVIPSPQLLIKELESFMPDLIRNKNKQIKEWLNNAIYELKCMSGTIEDFVKQQNSLRKIENIFPDVRDEFSVLQFQLMICQQYKFEIKKDDENAFSDTTNAQNNLNNACQNANDSQEKNLESFSQKITKQLIPELQQNIQDISNQFQDTKYIDKATPQDTAIQELEQLTKQFEVLEEQSKKYNFYQQTLRLEETVFEEIVECKLDLKVRLDMWTHLRDWKVLTDEWIDGRFININTDVIRNKAQIFSQVVGKASKRLVSNAVLDELRERVFSFKDTMPVVIALRNKNLKSYHWKAIKELVGQEFDVLDTEFTLRKLMDMNVIEKQKEIQDISTQATQEDILEKQFNALDAEWKDLKFETIEYKAEERSKEQTYILSKIDDLYQVIDDLLANLNNILGSRYIGNLRQKAEERQNHILHAQRTIDDWLVCQKNWIYLENIFNSQDIRKRLAAESQQFDLVDKFFKGKTKKAHKEKFVYQITPNLYFTQQKDSLNAIYKSIENYLEVKKVSFPRFYFLSNDELLDILAKAQDIQNIQKHIKKLFDNIALLDLGDDPRNTSVLGMISHEKEIVPFYKMVQTKTEIEGWLCNLEDEMLNTLKKYMKTGRYDYENVERKEWVQKHPGQVVATISQYYWTNQSEVYIYQLEENPNSILEWYQINLMQLSQLSELIREGLDPIKHQIIVSLITVDVHNRDIVEGLANQDIQSVNDFFWQQQLKYYWEENIDIVVVRQVNSQLRYGYEYMGATSRLVITPLTDRCWITITGALNIKLGAAPQGPAGTGKTESTKDLAKAIGQLCIVYNCSEQVGYKIMQNHFSGLAQQGAWTCLDEFNRIDIEVLSVIAQQLRSIRNALLENAPEFYFMVSTIKLNPGIGVFITMNPGYAGRTELPDNLKVLFRPVCMMIPYYQLIAQITLFAEGFENAQPLSQKMFQLYKLSSEQLSQQKHYDFGLRAVKSVLNMAGKNKRANPELNEDLLLIQAMCDSNIPKFLKDDLILFQALINDLFPEAQLIEKEYGQIMSEINKVMDSKNLQQVPNLQKKVIQLFETLNVRFGVMIIGNTGSGKSTCYQVLQQTLTNLFENPDIKDNRFQKVTADVLNPKCITMGELYGEVNDFTKEWQDGLASMIMRDLAAKTTDENNWVVFDGPVDALWIENMNTVLDDNCMLCLANGQRIKLRQQMKMLFEVQDLAVASPATVSRCGMVYTTSDDLGWKPYVVSWINRYFGVYSPEFITHQEYQDATANKASPNTSDYIYKEDEDFNYELRNNLYNLFDNSVESFFEQFRDSGHYFEPIKSTDLQLVMSLCNLLEMLLSPQYGFKMKMKQQEKQRYVLYAFIFGFIWSMGVTVSETSHNKIDIFIRKKFESVLFPNNEDVYGVYFDPNSLNYSPWTDIIPEFEYNKEIPYFQMMVPTVDTISHCYIIEQLLVKKKQVFLTGGTGTGKSVLLQNLLNQIKEPRSIDPVGLMFSAKTSSYVTQQTIESKLKVIKKQLLGAKPGRQIAIFIDDINMPSNEENFGAQPPIELLRLIIDRGGIYDRKELYWKKIQDTMIIGCAAPPEGGRYELTPRFTSRFNLFCFPQASYKVLYKIFNSLLDGYLQTGFQDSVKSKSGEVVNATIDIYNRILAEKKAIPRKFHYTFNLRDVSKVIQGILSVRPVSCKEGDQLIKLWIHEASRVFHDRLVDNEDREWFQQTIIEILGTNFRVSWQVEEVFNENDIKFGDLLQLDFPERNYQLIRDEKKLLKVLDDKLDEYNMEYSPMKLVFFSDAINHILRITRVLRSPRGNMMLIGVGGCGKQSLTRLACYLYEIQCYQIEITKNFDLTAFREFVGNVMQESGVKGKKTAFLFTDAQIVKETFLEDINNLLNSGDIPNIWEPDVKKQIEDDVRPINEQLKRVGEPDVIYSTFVERVRDNMHLVLCMSPVGEKLRIRCRQFPALVNCCTLDWFSAWPEEALVSVGSTLLSDFHFDTDAERNGIVQMCKEAHLKNKVVLDKFEQQLKRKVFVTPKTYLDLINLYMDMLTEKRGEINGNIKRLSNGLTKLEQANQQVAELQVVLKDLQPELEKSSIQVQEFLEKLQVDSAKAKEKEITVEREAEIVNKQKNEITMIADEAREELAQAEPELKKAEDSVKNIDRNSLTMVRSFPQPPAVVERIFEGVCIFFNKKYDWATAKLLMADLKGFIDMLLNYDKESIKPNTIKRVRELIDKYPDDFDPKKVENRASAAANVCVWILAMELYYKINKKVMPKKKKVAELEAKQAQAEAILNEKVAILNEAKAVVDKLQADNKQAIDKKNYLENQKESTIAKLSRAEKLVVLLKDEGENWKQKLAELKDNSAYIVGDVFLSCSQMTYCGPYTGVYRQELQNMLIEFAAEQEIKISEQFSLLKCLGDPMMIRDWINYGLPSDTVSCENSIITTKGNRYPLLIDPQMQAIKWVQNMEKPNQLRVLKFKEKQFQLQMRTCLTQGYPCLIEDTTEVIDALIDPILTKQFTTNNDGNLQIKFADEDLHFDTNFRLFMTTKIPNPQYLPDIFIKSNVINFTVTFEGLQEQLLTEVMKKEQPVIEEQSDQNIINLSNYRKKKVECENNILKLLNSTKSDQLLDDESLVQTLETSKVTATEINEKIEESIKMEEKINQTRDCYKEVSKRGSILFFVIKDLGLIVDMYQYSLQYIQKLFVLAMNQAEENDDVEVRKMNLINKISQNMFTNVSRGLFEEHKLIFSFLIATSVEKYDKRLDNAMWSVFLRGAGIIDPKNIRPNPDSKLMTQLNWDLAQYLAQQFECFKELDLKIEQELEKWNKWSKSENIIEVNPPEPYQDLEVFERMLLIKIFKQEKLYGCAGQYVMKKLGQFYLESPETKMETIYQDSDQKTPIIFILSQGADPTQLLINFAQDKGMMGERFRDISLGQGQGKPATKLIEEGKKDGKWVLLQNCHLSKTWMPELEILVQEIEQNYQDVHRDFRLFLTSEPVSYFPVSILQNGIKLTTEPPRGVKANLKRQIGNITEEFLDSCNKGNQIFHKMLMGLLFFHSILQERRKFGPVGFNIRYEFNDSDLETSSKVLLMLLNEQQQIPWDALIYVTGNINYGGRVTDDFDRRCLLTILKKFYVKDILQEKFQFSTSKKYYIPEVGDLESYKKFIDELPLNDDPEVFGMHENSNINFQAQESEKMIQTILSIQPREGGGDSGKSPDQIVTELAELQLSELPDNLKPEEGNPDLFVRNEMDLVPSLTTVLLQESQRFNMLITTIRNSFNDLINAIKGLLPMSSSLDSMYQSLLNNQVPLLWENVAYASLKPLASWLRDFKLRIQFMQNWITNGNPQAYWMSGLYYPHGFLTGVLQTHARKYKTPIDLLGFSFKILDIDKDGSYSRPNDGVYIYGFYLEGATWDRKKKTLIDQLPGEMYTSMPLIYFNPVENYFSKDQDYSCPLYKTSIRKGQLSTTGQSTNYILCIDIPTLEESADFWIQRGTAMLTQLND